MDIILMEDDCAPDARESFESEFIRIVGISLKEFKSKATHTTEDNGYYQYWCYEAFILQFSADDPYYTLAITS